jgi:hypothetical protein
MSRPNIRIHNTKTNEIIDREMNDDELAIYQAEQKYFADLEEERNKALEAKAAAETKLAALGLTTDDLKALGIN